jgi:hypothetical protein
MTMKPYPHFRDVERRAGITWHDLVELDSRLAALLWEARRACVACRCWSDVDQAFAPIRNALSELVGFAVRSCRHPALFGSGAYEVAYWKLYDAVAGLLPGAATVSASDCPAQELEEAPAQAAPTEPNTVASELAAA